MNKQIPTIFAVIILAAMVLVVGILYYFLILNSEAAEIRVYKTAYSDRVADDRLAKKVNFEASNLILPDNVKRQRNKWTIKKISGDKEDNIYSREVYGFPEILHWQDYLIFEDSIGKAYSDDHVIILRAYNLKTGESHLLFQEKTETYINYIDVIEGTLYFATGGYMMMATSYWVDLPPINQAKKLIDIRNGSVMSWRGHYWLVGGEGDACWGMRDYYLLDTEKKEAKFITASHLGCGEGEELIDLDKREKMLMAYHNDISNYFYVSAISLDDPSVKEIIISKDDMPGSILGINYFEDQDKLLLLGKEFSYFDFSSGIVKKLIDVPDEYWSEWRTLVEEQSSGGPSAYFWDKDIICINEPKYNKNVDTEIDLASGDFKRNSEKCRAVFEGLQEEQLVGKEKVQQQIDRLNLPKNYVLVYEDVDMTR